jgi:splicing factor 3B subunit 1
MSIEPDEDIDEDEDEYAPSIQQLAKSNGTNKSSNMNIQKYFNEMAEKADATASNPFEDKRVPTIADRERGTYNEKRQKIQLSPGARYDPFAEGSQTPDIRSERRTHFAVMNEVNVVNEKIELERILREKAKAGELKAVNNSGADGSGGKKKRRWDQTVNEIVDTSDAITPRVLATGKDAETPAHAKIWDPTPGHADSGALTPPDLTPGAGLSETPRVKSGTGAAGSRRRWDETPKTDRNTGNLCDFIQIMAYVF